MLIHENKSWSLQGNIFKSICKQKQMHESPKSLRPESTKKIFLTHADFQHHSSVCIVKDF